MLPEIYELEHKRKPAPKWLVVVALTVTALIYSILLFNCGG